MSRRDFTSRSFGLHLLAVGLAATLSALSIESEFEQGEPLVSQAMRADFIVSDATRLLPLATHAPALAVGFRVAPADERLVLGQFTRPGPHKEGIDDAVADIAALLTEAGWDRACFRRRLVGVARSLSHLASAPLRQQIEESELESSRLACLCLLAELEPMQLTVADKAWMRNLTFECGSPPTRAWARESAAFVLARTGSDAERVEMLGVATANHDLTLGSGLRWALGASPEGCMATYVTDALCLEQDHVALNQLLSLVPELATASVSDQVTTRLQRRLHELAIEPSLQINLRQRAFAAHSLLAPTATIDLAHGLALDPRTPRALQLVAAQVQSRNAAADLLCTQL